MLIKARWFRQHCTSSAFSTLVSKRAAICAYKVRKFENFCVQTSKGTLRSALASRCACPAGIVSTFCLRNVNTMWCIAHYQVGTYLATLFSFLERMSNCVNFVSRCLLLCTKNFGLGIIIYDRIRVKVSLSLPEIQTSTYLFQGLVVLHAEPCPFP